MIGCIFIFDGGYYIFSLFDENVTLFSCFIICLIETLIAGYYIGSVKLQKLSVELTDQSIPEYFITSYKIYCPAVFSAFTLMALYRLIFEGEYYPILWPKLLKYFIILAPLIVIVYFYLKYKDDKVEEDMEIELN